MPDLFFPAVRVALVMTASLPARAGRKGCAPLVESGSARLNEALARAFHAEDAATLASSVIREPMEK
jgi:hypothetical protein